MSINPVWRGSLSRDASHQFDNKSYNASDPAANLFIDLFGDPLTFDELAKESDRQFLVKVDIAGTEYDNTTIVDFNIENSLTLSDEFELGTTVLSKFVLTIRTQDVVPANARIVPYLVMASNGLPATEWMPMGEFFVDNRSEINGVWTFTCYDKLVWADVPYVSQLTYPATMQAVWDEICTRLGYTHNVTINPAYQIEVGPAGYSCRQVLGYIASANSACVYVDREGAIRFRQFAASDEPTREITKREYIRVTQTNPVKTYTKVVVVYNTEEGLAFEAGSGDENHTLYVENPFGTQQMANDLLAHLNGFSYMPIKMDAIGIPHEMGDRMRFGTPVESPTWEDADMTWEDADFTWDGYEAGGGESLALHSVYSFKGGLKMSVEAPSISEQQSEFQVEGELTQQINRLRATSIREGKPYYGLTITRTEGLTIEREDHKSKLILNSDVMDWQVDGVSSLYYDALANRLKFKGTLEGVDGIFSGSLQAATGTFTGELLAASGTFKGNLSAAGGTFTGTLVGVDGDFSGTISAATMLGGTITGALIRTATSGKRIELSSTGNVFRAIADNGDTITISPDYGGSSPGIVINRSGNIFAIQFLPEIGVGFTTTSGDVVFNPNGRIGLFGNYVEIENWGKLRSRDTGRTLQQELSGGGSGYTGQFNVVTDVDFAQQTLMLRTQRYVNGVLVETW